MTPTWQQRMWIQVIVGAVSGIVGPAAAAPNQVQHQPVTATVIGEEIPVVVKLPGAGADPLTVTLFHASDGSVKQIALERTGGDEFLGIIPASATLGISLRYWIDIKSPGFSFQVGTAGMPMRVDLLEPPPPPPRPILAPITAACATLALLAILFRIARARNRKAVLEEIFWVRTLYPLSGLRKTELAPALLRLSREPLHHPLRGLTMFPSSAIYERFRTISEVNFKLLSRRRDRSLERDHPWYGLILPPPLEQSEETDSKHSADTAFIGMSTGAFRIKLKKDRAVAAEFDPVVDLVLDLDADGEHGQPDGDLEPLQASSPRSA